MLKLTRNLASAVALHRHQDADLPRGLRRKVNPAVVIALQLRNPSMGIMCLLHRHYNHSITAAVEGSLLMGKKEEVELLPLHPLTNLLLWPGRRNHQLSRSHLPMIMSSCVMEQHRQLSVALLRDRRKLTQKVHLPPQLQLLMRNQLIVSKKKRNRRLLKRRYNQQLRPPLLLTSTQLSCMPSISSCNNSNPLHLPLLILTRSLLIWHISSTMPVIMQGYQERHQTLLPLLCSLPKVDREHLQQLGFLPCTVTLLLPQLSMIHHIQ